VTADEFETLDALQAELWLARRFRDFVRSGFPPDLSLLFAAHPEVEVPAGPDARTADSTAWDTAA
jgi:hypothetical protein